MNSGFKLDDKSAKFLSNFLVGVVMGVLAFCVALHAITIEGKTKH